MAGNIKLDLKEFKHVTSDDKSTTLQHKLGHQLVLAHKALSPEAQIQLKALAGIGKQDQTSDQANQAKDEKRVHLAEGGDFDKNRWETTRIKSLVSPKKEAAPAPHAKPTQESSMGDSSWPSPSQTSVGKAEAAKPKRAPAEESSTEGYTDVPKNKYAEGGDVEHVPTEAEVEEGIAKEEAAQQQQAMPPSPQAEREVPVAEHVGNLFGTYGVKPVIDAVASLGRNAIEGVKTAGQAAGNFTQGLEKSTGVSLPVSHAEENDRQDAQEQALANNAEAATTPMPEQPQAAMAPPMAPQGLPGAGSAHDPEQMLAQGYSQQMQGIKEEAAAKAQLGAAQSGLLEQQAKTQAIAEQSFKDHYQALEQERQAHMADIKNGYIDPDQYWKGQKDASGNMVGGHSKIAAGIGMILAGFNPTNSPNAAINFLKYNMDQNIEAQKQNLGEKQNLLAANLRQFGNLRDAVDMTRIMQNDIVSNQLLSASAQAQTPMAKAAAENAAGQLQQQTAPLFQQFAMRRAMMNLANNGGGDSPGAVEHMLGYMRVMNPEMAKEMETRYVPGVGLAATPVPQEVRGQLIAKQQFGAAVNDLKQWAQAHSGSLRPTQIAEGKTKAANVQNLYRQGINGGVFKQGEQSFINGIIDSEPTKFFNNIRVLPKLNEAARENDASLNILKKGYGLPVHQQQEASQPQIKVVNGVKYMRGPNGEAIPVK